MSRGSIDDAWRVIDSLRQDVSQIAADVHGLKIESEHCKKNQEQAHQDFKDMCTQLKTTENSIREDMKGNTESLHKSVAYQGELVAAQMKILMDAHLLRKGAESAAIGIAKHAPKIIWALASAAFTAGIIWATKS